MEQESEEQRKKTLKMENPKKYVTDGKRERKKRILKKSCLKNSTSKEINSKKVHRFWVIHSSQQKVQKLVTCHCHSSFKNERGKEIKRWIEKIMCIMKSSFM